MNTFPDVMTPEQAQAYLQIGRTTLYREIKKGTIPYTRIGKVYRFSRDALDGFVKYGPSAQAGRLVADRELSRTAARGKKRTPRHRTGKLPPEVREQKKREFLGHLRHGHTLKAAAAAVGVSDVAARNWRHVDPDYDNEVQVILDARKF